MTNDALPSQRGGKAPRGGSRRGRKEPAAPIGRGIGIRQFDTVEIDAVLENVHSEAENKKIQKIRRRRMSVSRVSRRAEGGKKWRGKKRDRKGEAMERGGEREDGAKSQSGERERRRRRRRRGPSGRRPFSTLTVGGGAAQSISSPFFALSPLSNPLPSFFPSQDIRYKREKSFWLGMFCSRP